MRLSIFNAALCILFAHVVHVKALEGTYTRTSFGNAPGYSGCTYPSKCADECALGYVVYRASYGNYSMTPNAVPTTNDCYLSECYLVSLEDGTEQASGIVSGVWKQQGVSVGTMWMYKESDTVLRVDTMLNTESRWCRAYYDSSSVSSAKSFRSFLLLSVVSTIFNLASV